MIEFLNDIDIWLFELLNFNGGQAISSSMSLLSDKLIWIPLYALLIYQLILKYQWKVWVVLVGIILLITITDQFTSSFMKPYFGRLRPCHQLISFQDIFVPYSCGGLYGFASSHAANTFGLAIFFHLLIKESWTYWLIFWSVLVSYSRIYLAAHFPGDIIVGFIVGTLAALLIYNILKHIKFLHE